MTDREKFCKLYNYIKSMERMLEAEQDVRFAEEELCDDNDFGWMELSGKLHTARRISVYAGYLMNMHEYTVRVFARHDHGEDDPTFDEAGMPDLHYDREERARACASEMAVHDWAVRNLGNRCDGFAIVVYEDSEAIVCYEHDGISLNTWHRYEISDSIFNK